MAKKASGTRGRRPNLASMAAQNRAEYLRVYNLFKREINAVKQIAEAEKEVEEDPKSLEVCQIGPEEIRVNTILGQIEQEYFSSPILNSSDRRVMEGGAKGTGSKMKQIAKAVIKAPTKVSAIQATFTDACTVTANAAVMREVIEEAQKNTPPNPEEVIAKIEKGNKYLDTMISMYHSVAFRALLSVGVSYFANDFSLSLSAILGGLFSFSDLTIGTFIQNLLGAAVFLPFRLLLAGLQSTAYKWYICGNILQIVSSPYITGLKKIYNEGLAKALQDGYDTINNFDHSQLTAEWFTRKAITLTFQILADPSWTEAEIQSRLNKFYKDIKEGQKIAQKRDPMASINTAVLKNMKSRISRQVGKSKSSIGFGLKNAINENAKIIENNMRATQKIKEISQAKKAALKQKEDRAVELQVKQQKGEISSEEITELAHLIAELKALTNPAYTVNVAGLQSRAEGKRETERLSAKTASSLATTTVSKFRFEQARQSLKRKSEQKKAKIRRAALAAIKEKNEEDERRTRRRNRH